MMFSRFLRIASILVCTQNLSFASETKFSYVNKGDVLKQWSSREEYNQSFQEFLMQEQRISEYVEKKRKHTIEYNLIKENGKFLDGIVSCASPFLGAFTFSFVGGGIGGKDGLLAGFTVGMALGGIFGLYNYVRNFDYYSQENYRQGLYSQMTLEETLRTYLEKDISRELYEQEYLTKNWLYPVPENKKKVEDFINLILKKDATPGKVKLS